jgi:hypothetical protein
VEVAAVPDHPYLTHWEILVAVAFVEIRCQSSQVAYSHPYQPNLAFRFRMEYLACPQVADEYGRCLVDPVARVGRVAPPSAVEVETETLNVAFEGHH